MRITIAWALLAIAVTSAPAATIWVDDDNTSGIENGSPAYPYNTIQEALYAALSGDTVVVCPGTYNEIVSFFPTSISYDFTLRSTDPEDPAVVAATVIDGSGLGWCVVSFKEQNDETVVLAGFTITGGDAERGGGVWGREGSPTLYRCVITGNTATMQGGGVYDCHGPIIGCQITDNTAQYDAGGGLKDCSGPITNCLMAGNTAPLGAGMFGCHGFVTNCTVADNNGPGMEECGQARNCIVWGNSWPQIDDDSRFPVHCCIEDWSYYHPGPGNIHSNPQFANAGAGDYRLLATSPCVDTGARALWALPPVSDLDRNCRIVGPLIDMGAYEYGSSPDGDGDLLPDADEAAHGGNPSLPDTDGDLLVDGLEVLRGTNPAVVDVPGTMEVPADFSYVQDALNVCAPGDEVVVSPGTYNESLYTLGVGDLTLRGTDPDDPAVVAATVIDADIDGDPDTPGHPALTLQGEGPASLVAGLTLTGGHSDICGGGVCGYNSSATITRCVIANNVADTSGGGLSYCAGEVSYNTISGNTAKDDGGGLFACVEVYYNTITDNEATASAKSYGGGLYSCTYVVGNVIEGNDADRGDALYGCSTLIENNIIKNNGATYGIQYCHGDIINNTIINDGMYGCGFVWYQDMSGGYWMWAGHDCYIVNNIICDDDPRLQGLVTLENCWVGADPQLVDPDNGDYRLLPTSPCIDAGDGDWAPEFDRDGLPRYDDPDTANTGVGTPPYTDIGAHEYWTGVSGALGIGWNLMSFPLEPVCCECSAALDDCIAAGNDITNNLFRYAAGSGYEIYPGTFTEAGRGCGYWLSLDAAATEDLAGAKAAGDVEIALSDGWNLVGHPHPEAVLYSGCSVSDGVETRSVPDAEAAGWLDPAVYYYDGGAYSTLRSDGTGDDDSLRPWYGYWLLANQAGLTLIVP